MARDPESHAYDVSVVVFYKRPLPTEDPATALGMASDLDGYSDIIGQNERTVRASIVSSSPNGGEILLEDLNDIDNKSPFDNLRTSEWIMLCGPQQNKPRDSGDPVFELNWYQVVAVDSDPTNNPARRLVTVRGPRWSWEPNTQISNNLCAAICRGAVAVHAKTMRLESSLGSAWGL
jgi:hypothetical protein